MNEAMARTGGIINEAWEQITSGAFWRVEKTIIRDDVFERRVIFHLETGDDVAWSPVTLEELVILRQESDSGGGLVLLFGGGGGQDAFEGIIQDMRTEFEAADGREKGIRSALDRLRSYLALFARKRNLFPPEQVLRGLLGELVVMRRLHEAGMSMSILLDSWEGPGGGHQDFVFQSTGTALEVKSALALEAKVRVSNERQLDETGTEALFLTVIKWKEAPGGVDVSEMVEDIMAMMSSWERRRLESKLEKDMKLPKWIRDLLPPYRLLELQGSPLCYEIRGDSLVLRHSDLDESVSMVSYDLDYSALAPSQCEFDGMAQKLIG